MGGAVSSAAATTSANGDEMGSGSEPHRASDARADVPSINSSSLVANRNPLHAPSVLRNESTTIAGERAHKKKMGWVSDPLETSSSKTRDSCVATPTRSATEDTQASEETESTTVVAFRRSDSSSSSDDSRNPLLGRTEKRREKVGGPSRKSSIPTHAVVESDSDEEHEEEGGDTNDTKHAKMQNNAGNDNDNDGDDDSDVSDTLPLLSPPTAASPTSRVPPAPQPINTIAPAGMVGPPSTEAMDNGRRAAGLPSASSQVNHQTITSAASAVPTVSSAPAAANPRIQPNPASPSPRRALQPPSVTSATIPAAANRRNDQPPSHPSVSVSAASGWKRRDVRSVYRDVFAPLPPLPSPQQIQFFNRVKAVGGFEGIGGAPADQLVNPLAPQAHFNTVALTNVLFQKHYKIMIDLFLKCSAKETTYGTPFESFVLNERHQAYLGEYCSANIASLRATSVANNSATATNAAAAHENSDSPTNEENDSNAHRNGQASEKGVKNMPTFPPHRHAQTVITEAVDKVAPLTRCKLPGIGDKDGDGSNDDGDDDDDDDDVDDGDDLASIPSVSDLNETADVRSSRRGPWEREKSLKATARRHARENLSEFEAQTEKNATQRNFRAFSAIFQQTAEKAVCNICNDLPFMPPNQPLDQHWILDGLFIYEWHLPPLLARSLANREIKAAKELLQLGIDGLTVPAVTTLTYGNRVFTAMALIPIQPFRSQARPGSCVSRRFDLLPQVKGSRSTDIEGMIAEVSLTLAIFPIQNASYEVHRGLDGRAYFIGNILWFAPFSTLNVNAVLLKSDGLRAPPPLETLVPRIRKREKKQRRQQRRANEQQPQQFRILPTGEIVPFNPSSSTAASSAARQSAQQSQSRVVVTPADVLEMSSEEAGTYLTAIGARGVMWTPADWLLYSRSSSVSSLADNTTNTNAALNYYRAMGATAENNTVSPYGELLALGTGLDSALRETSAVAAGAGGPRQQHSAGNAVNNTDAVNSSADDGSARYHASQRAAIVICMMNHSVKTTPATLRPIRVLDARGATEKCSQHVAMSLQSAVAVIEQLVADADAADELSGRDVRQDALDDDDHDEDGTGGGQRTAISGAATASSLSALTAAGRHRGGGNTTTNVSSGAISPSSQRMQSPESSISPSGLAARSPTTAVPAGSMSFSAVIPSSSSAVNAQPPNATAPTHHQSLSSPPHQRNHHTTNPTLHFNSLNSQGGFASSIALAGGGVMGANGIGNVARLTSNGLLDGDEGDNRSVNASSFSVRALPPRRSQSSSLFHNNSITTNNSITRRPSLPHLNANQLNVVSREHRRSMSSSSVFASSGAGGVGVGFNNTNNNNDVYNRDAETRNSLAWFVRQQRDAEAAARLRQVAPSTSSGAVGHHLNFGTASFLSTANSVVSNVSVVSQAPSGLSAGGRVTMALLKKHLLIPSRFVLVVAQALMGKTRYLHRLDPLFGYVIGKAVRDLMVSQTSGEMAWGYADALSAQRKRDKERRRRAALRKKKAVAESTRLMPPKENDRGVDSEADHSAADTADEEDEVYNKNATNRREGHIPTGLAPNSVTEPYRMLMQLELDATLSSRWCMTVLIPAILARFPCVGSGMDLFARHVLFSARMRREAVKIIDRHIQRDWSSSTALGDEEGADDAEEDGGLSAAFEEALLAAESQRNGGRPSAASNAHQNDGVFGGDGGGAEKERQSPPRQQRATDLLSDYERDLRRDRIRKELEEQWRIEAQIKEANARAKQKAAAEASSSGPIAWLKRLFTKDENKDENTAHEERPLHQRPPKLPPAPQKHYRFRCYSKPLAEPLNILIDYDAVHTIAAARSGISGKHCRPLTMPFLVRQLDDLASEVEVSDVNRVQDGLLELEDAHVGAVVTESFPTVDSSSSLSNGECVAARLRRLLGLKLLYRGYKEDAFEMLRMYGEWYDKRNMLMLMAAAAQQPLAYFHHGGGAAPQSFLDIHVMSELAVLVSRLNYLKAFDRELKAIKEKAGEKSTSRAQEETTIQVAVTEDVNAGGANNDASPPDVTSPLLLPPQTNLLSAKHTAMHQQRPLSNESKLSTSRHTQPPLSPTSPLPSNMTQADSASVPAKITDGNQSASSDATAAGFKQLMATSLFPSAQAFNEAVDQLTPPRSSERSKIRTLETLIRKLEVRSAKLKKFVDQDTARLSASLDSLVFLESFAKSHQPKQWMNPPLYMKLAFLLVEKEVLRLVLSLQQTERHLLKSQRGLAAKEGMLFNAQCAMRKVEKELLRRRCDEGEVGEENEKVGDGLQQANAVKSGVSMMPSKTVSMPSNKQPSSSDASLDAISRALREEDEAYRMFMAQQTALPSLKEELDRMVSQRASVMTIRDRLFLLAEFFKQQPIDEPKEARLVIDLLMPVMGTVQSVYAREAAAREAKRSSRHLPPAAASASVKAVKFLATQAQSNAGGQEEENGQNKKLGDGGVPTNHATERARNASVILSATNSVSSSTEVVKQAQQDAATPSNMKAHSPPSLESNNNNNKPPRAAGDDDESSPLTSGRAEKNAAEREVVEEDGQSIIEPTLTAYSRVDASCWAAVAQLCAHLLQLALDCFDQHLGSPSDASISVMHTLAVFLYTTGLKVRGIEVAKAAVQLSVLNSSKEKYVHRYTSLLLLGRLQKRSDLLRQSAHTLEAAEMFRFLATNPRASPEAVAARFSKNMRQAIFDELMKGGTDQGGNNNSHNGSNSSQPQRREGSSSLSHSASLSSFPALSATQHATNDRQKGAAHHVVVGGPRDEEEDVHHHTSTPPPDGEDGEEDHNDTDNEDEADEGVGVTVRSGLSATTGADWTNDTAVVSGPISDGDSDAEVVGQVSTSTQRRRARQRRQREQLVAGMPLTGTVLAVGGALVAGHTPSPPRAPPRRPRGHHHQQQGGEEGEAGSSRASSNASSSSSSAAIRLKSKLRAANENNRSDGGENKQNSSPQRRVQIVDLRSSGGEQGDTREALSDGSPLAFESRNRGEEGTSPVATFKKQPMMTAPLTAEQQRIRRIRLRVFIRSANVIQRWWRGRLVLLERRVDPPPSTSLKEVGDGDAHSAEGSGEGGKEKATPRAEAGGRQLQTIDKRYPINRQGPMHDRHSDDSQQRRGDGENGKESPKFSPTVLLENEAAAGAATRLGQPTPTSSSSVFATISHVASLNGGGAGSFLSFQKRGSGSGKSGSSDGSGPSRSDAVAAASVAKTTTAGTTAVAMGSRPLLPQSKNAAADEQRKRSLVHSATQSLSATSITTTDAVSNSSAGHRRRRESNATNAQHQAFSSSPPPVSQQSARSPRSIQTVYLGPPPASPPSVISASTLSSPPPPPPPMAPPSLTSGHAIIAPTTAADDKAMLVAEETLGGSGLISSHHLHNNKNNHAVMFGGHGGGGNATPPIATLLNSVLANTSSRPTSATISGADEVVARSSRASVSFSGGLPPPIGSVSGLLTHTSAAAATMPTASGGGSKAPSRASGGSVIPFDDDDDDV